MKYIVTKEIKSETQVYWFIYIKDFFMMLVWGMLTFTTRSYVHSSLEWVYVVFSLLVGVRLVLPSRGNPNRKYYQSIALYLLRPNKIYRYYKEAEDEKA